jgi:hypothetical protein
VADAQGRLLQDRRDLSAALERLGVERDRAARERDAEAQRRAALAQQCKLLEAVVHRKGGAGPRRGVRKENSGGTAGLWPKGLLADSSEY